MAKDFSLKLEGSMLEAGVKPNTRRRGSTPAKRGAESLAEDHMHTISQSRHFPEPAPVDHFRLLL